ncbi:MAG: YqhA family protein [Chlorobium sp.]
MNKNKLKSIIENVFETLLFNTRFIVITAVLGSLVASVIMYVQGTLLVYNGFNIFIEELNSAEGHLTHELVPLLISSIDDYLFATVLLIFSMGLYELFISEIDPASRTSDSRPNWLNISSLDDLKGALGKVILMILIVSFFEKSLDIKYENSLDLLYLGVGVILISGALFLTHLQHAHPNDSHKEHKS